LPQTSPGAGAPCPPAASPSGAGTPPSM
jgi:hypothetical protein